MARRLFSWIGPVKVVVALGFNGVVNEVAAFSQFHHGAIGGKGIAVRKAVVVIDDHIFFLQMG